MLNHQLLPLILTKAEFNSKVSNFFKNYLVDRKTKYLWNNFSSSYCNVDIGIGQGSALSPILSTLYLSSIFYILEKHLKNLKIPILFLSFVDDGLFITQHKSISVLNANLYHSYNIISSLFIRFGLVVEYSKTEVFHFSRLQDIFNSPSLDFSTLEDPILLLKTMWQYLEFFFDQKLTFCHYINFYTNRAIFTIKCIKMLGNSLKNLISLQKW